MTDAHDVAPTRVAIQRPNTAALSALTNATTPSSVQLDKMFELRMWLPAVTTLL
jgi:hypothetical protein